MDHRQDPIKARYGVGALFELAGQEEIPRVHILKRRWGERSARSAEEILLQTARQVVRVAEEEVLREIDHLVQSLIPQLRNLAIAQSQSHGTLPAIPHGEQHRRRVAAEVGGVEARRGGVQGVRVGGRARRGLPALGRLERERLDALDRVYAVPPDVPHLGPLRYQRQVVTVQEPHKPQYAVRLGYRLQPARRPPGGDADAGGARVRRAIVVSPGGGVVRRIAVVVVLLLEGHPPRLQLRENYQH